MGHNTEHYAIVDENNEILGEIELTIKKYPPESFNRTFYETDPSHVFVNELKNYSNPTTPYHRKELEYHKDIGTRLMQIAQRRSDEALCNGNIKLISKNESKNWYKNVIGMREEYPIQPYSQFKITVHNPNSMYLPPESKEPLSQLQGGL